MLLPWLLLLGVGRSRSAPSWAVEQGHTCGGKCNTGTGGDSLHYFSMTDYNLVECTNKCLSIGCACFDWSDDKRVRPGERCRICPPGVEPAPLAVSHWGYTSHICSGSDCHSGNGTFVALLILLGAAGLYVGAGAAYGKRAGYRPIAGVPGLLATHPHAPWLISLAGMVRDGTAMVRRGRGATSARAGRAAAVQPLLGDGVGKKSSKRSKKEKEKEKKSGKVKKGGSNKDSIGSSSSARSAGADDKQSPQYKEREGERERDPSWLGSGTVLAERRDEQVHSSQQKIRVVVDS